MATVAASLILILASCGRPPQIVASPPFDEVFELAEIIELGEDPADSIAEVGVFVERQDGGFIIGDWILPRVRTYTDDGSLEAGFGRFGDGPWELQRISGVAEAFAIGHASYCDRVTYGIWRSGYRCLVPAVWIIEPQPRGGGCPEPS